LRSVELLPGSGGYPSIICILNGKPEFGQVNERISLIEELLELLECVTDLINARTPSMWDLNFGCPMSPVNHWKCLVLRLPFTRWVLLPKLIQHTWRQTLIDEVVSIVSDDAGALHFRGVKCPLPQSEYLLVKLNRECACPRSQFP